MKKYEAVIVDFGGVLTTPLEDAMQSFAESRGIDLQHLVRVALAAYHGEGDELVVRFEKGQMDDAEFALEFAQRLSDVTGVDVAADQLLHDLLGTLQLEEDMIEAVRRARAAGLKTALLSNSWGLELYPRDLLVEICDVVVISGEVGMRKPDRDIFDLTLEKLGLKADACVFVDDHPGHLKTAQEVGMTTVIHRTPRETIAELERLLGLSLSESVR
jgi:putative hydrolase of the HAD superfamily